MLLLLLIAGTVNILLAEPLDGAILLLFVLVVVGISIVQGHKTETLLLLRVTFRQLVHWSFVTASQFVFPAAMLCGVTSSCSPRATGFRPTRSSLRRQTYRSTSLRSPASPFPYANSPH